MSSVSRTSTHPEKAVEYFNYLYANKDYLNTLCCGIEGEHWILDTDQVNHLTLTEMGENHPLNGIVWQLGTGISNQQPAESKRGRPKINGLLLMSQLMPRQC